MTDSLGTPTIGERQAIAELRELLRQTANALACSDKSDPLEPIADNGMTVWDGMRAESKRLWPLVTKALSQTPTTNAPVADREAIARIIAPGSWQAYDRFIDPAAQPKTQLFVMIYRQGLTTPEQWVKWWAEDAAPPHIDYHMGEWRESLRKADRILSLTKNVATNAGMRDTDLGRIADGEQALVNEAPTGLHPAGFDPSRELGSCWPFGRGVLATRCAMSGDLALLTVFALPDGYTKEEGATAEVAVAKAIEFGGPRTTLTFPDAGSVRRLIDDLVALASGIEAVGSMTGPTPPRITSMTALEIAGSLSEGQKRAIIAARPLMAGGKLLYLPVYRDRGRLAESLVAIGLAMQTVNGTRLTPLGAEVRSLLKDNSDANG